MNESPSLTREEAFHRLTDILRCKWTLAILDAVARGITRPGQMQRELDGLTAKILNERIDKLERYGVIVRERQDQIVPHTEYRLTQRGNELVRLLDDLRTYAATWQV